jgi:hypothetical protein
MVELPAGKPAVVKWRAVAFQEWMAHDFDVLLFVH